MISTVKLRTLFFVISIVILLFENTKSSQTDENKPNIVIILADDMVLHRTNETNQKIEL